MSANFDDIMASVKEWIQELLQRCQYNITYEITHDQINCFRTVLNFKKHCIGEIIVSNVESFAPYRYVSFEVLGIEDGCEKYIYVWYDRERDELIDILHGLYNGIVIVEKWLTDNKRR